MNQDHPKIITAGTTASGKILLIVRHAKSSWESGTLNDFERPLNERGKRDAPMMAKRLSEKKVTIDAFVSSPAKRAKKTAEIFCHVYGKEETDIIYMSMLYQASVDVFYNVVAQLDDRFTRVAIFSHNTGITEFVNTLIDSFKIDNMPTCGIFGVHIQTEKWKDFRRGKKELLVYDYPKLVT